MTTKIVKLKEATEFAKENGYLLAVYKRKQTKDYYNIVTNNYEFIDDCYPDTVPLDIETDIIVSIVGCGLDFKEFTTADKQYCFILHNNFNVPKIIPIIQT